MEIILKEDVANLGYKNDIVTVKSGYGRNLVMVVTILFRLVRLSLLHRLPKKCWLKN